MRRILALPAVKVVCLYLVLVLSGTAALPSASFAAFVPPSAKILAGTGAPDLEGIQAALEDQLLAERLTALGLSAQEVKARLDSLTAGERSSVMADIDKVQAGGDGVSALVGLAVLVLLVILILKIMDKEITIK